MVIRVLKWSVLFLSSISLSTIANAQLAVQAQVGEISFQRSKLNGDTDTSKNNDDSKVKLNPEYNLGLSYKLEDIEILAGAGYAHYRLNDQSQVQDPGIGGRKRYLEYDYDYLNIQLSFGKAYRINSRFYWLAQAGIWHNRLFHRTEILRIEGYDEQSYFTGAIRQTRPLAKITTFGLFVSPGLFCNLTQNLSLGLQLRVGYYWDRQTGTDAVTEDSYNQNYQLTSTKLLFSSEENFNEIHFRYAPFFALKYEFRPHQ